MDFRRYVKVLRANPGFARLWGAQVISLLGDWFNTIVLSTQIAKYSPENTGLAVGLLLLARFLPPAVMSPLAGVLVDRFNRKQLLIWSNLLRAGVVLGFLVALDRPDLLWVLYLLTVVQFVLSSVFEPGQSALIPSLVQKDNLVEANTLISVTWSFMLALGAVIGGLVTTFVGPAAALIVDALTFLLAAALITTVPYTPRRKRPRTADAATHAQEDEDDTSFAEGLRFLRRNPRIATVLGVKFGGSLGNIDALMTIFATQIFVLGADGELSLGIMYSAFGVGAVAGPLLLNRFNDGSVPALQRMIIIGFVMAAAAWLLLGVAGTLVVLCLGLVLRAMGTSVNWTYSTVIIQKSTPDAYLGRTFSLDMMGFYIATVLSIIVHSTLIDLVGTQQAQLVALVTVLPALIPVALWAHFTRHTERNPAPLPSPVGD